MIPLSSILNPICAPNDFVRLVLRMESRHEIRLEIEGGGDRPGQFEDRLSAVFQSVRHRGLEFERLPPQTASDPAYPFLSYLEVRPRAIRLSGAREPLGFHPGPKLVSTATSLFVPGFLRPAPHRLSTAPIFLPFRDSAVSTVEIEFTRWILPPEWKAFIRQARDSRCGESFLMPEMRSSTDPLGQFLDWWMFSETGWEVRLRAGLATGSSPSTIALLELAGREVFGAPCKVRPFASGWRTRDSNRFLDLSSRIPQGWPLPELWSLGDEVHRLSGRRKYHSVAPALPYDGVRIGEVEGEEVRLPEATRDRHTYIVGATGTGKSTLLKRLVREDLRAGRSVVLLDPHGDLHGEILETMPENRWEDLFVIDPRSRLTPPGFNFLKVPRDQFFRRRVDFVIGELLRFFQENWNAPEAFGPMFELYFRNALLLLMLQDKTPVTLMDFERVFTDAEFRKHLLESTDDVGVRRFWQDLATKTTGDVALSNITPYITSKMHALTQGGFVTEMVSQTEDHVRLEERINEGCVFLVNLDKGLLGPQQSRLLGTMLTMQIFAAGLKRSTLPFEARRPINIYIDEFQNFVSDSISAMLSEARKFGLRLHLANQTLSQLSYRRTGGNLLESVLGNVGNLILFRLGVPDAERLDSHFHPFSRRQMLELRNYHALTRILTDEGPLRPFVMKTLP